MTPDPRPPEEYAYPSDEVTQCPYPFYAALREQAPAYRLPNGDFVVSRWDDIARVTREPEVFSSLVGPTNPHVLGGLRVGGDDAGPWPMSFCDDPQHKQGRLLNRSLVTSDRVERYQTLITRHADELIDAFASRGAAELRTELATPLPRRVMVEILGIPMEDEPRVAGWFGGQGPRGTRLTSADEQRAEQARTDDLRDYLRELVLDRAAEPRDDHLSDLIAAQVERDGELDVPYHLANTANLFGAALGTTAHFIANMMLLLLQHPDVLTAVRDDRSLARPVLEEALRAESPVQWSGRIAKVDTELHGVQIPAGSNILLMWGAANHDPDKFDDPERFDAGRPDVARHHVGFGHGIHRCLGAPLARLEAQIALDRSLDRLTGLRLVDGFEARWLPRVNQRAPESVDVVFDAG